jgi:hypothetical protein
MSERAIMTAGEQLLLRFGKDPLALAKAIKDQDLVSLAGAASIATAGVRRSLAMSDPARFKALSDAVTSYHLKGYGILDAAGLRQHAKRRLAGDAAEAASFDMAKQAGINALLSRLPSSR